MYIIGGARMIINDDAMTCHFCGIKSIEHPINNSTRDPVEIPEWLKRKLNNLIEQNKSTVKHYGKNMSIVDIAIYDREVSLIEHILSMKCGDE